MKTIIVLSLLLLIGCKEGGSSLEPPPNNLVDPEQQAACGEIPQHILRLAAAAERMHNDGIDWYYSDLEVVDQVILDGAVIMDGDLPDEMVRLQLQTGSVYGDFNEYHLFKYVDGYTCYFVSFIFIADSDLLLQSAGAILPQQ